MLVLTVVAFSLRKAPAFLPHLFAFVRPKTFGDEVGVFFVYVLSELNLGVASTIGGEARRRR